MSNPEPIAILGMACRFPGHADDSHALWRLLLDGVDAISTVPASRWNHDNVLHADTAVPGWVQTRHIGLIADPASFDAAFFGLSPREAALMDPQQRLLLHCAFEALEDAGLPASRLQSQRVGVYIGNCNREYAALQGVETADNSGLTGSAISMLSNRLSWYFDFHGPSCTIDTACSSSLYALHAAVAALRSGECDVALVGAANLLVSRTEFVTYGSGGVLSPDGRCRPFDRDGRGYVRSEGMAVMVVRRMTDAVRAADRILAQVLHTGVNQDGHSAALTVPSLEAQTALLRRVYAEAGVQPDEVSYIEAHGTGTPVGDPVEATALGTVLGQRRQRPLPIGSVKSNLGHLEGASGLAGVFKAVLVACHGRIPPTLHFRHPNPAIDFDGLGLQVVAETTEVSGPAVIGINSFGLGGANAHAIIAAAPARAPRTVSPSPGPWLLPLSAAHPSSFAARHQQIDTLLTQRVPIGDLCHQVSARSAHHVYRTATVVGRPTTDLGAEPCRGAQGRLVFAFCGQGAMTWQSGRELLEHEPVFAQVVEQCDAWTQAWGGWSLQQELLRAEGEQTDSVAHPLLFTVQMALVKLLESWGVRPSAVVGHSSGTAAALCCAGVLSLQDGLRAAFHRGRLLQEHAPAGGMLSVQLSALEVAPLTSDELVVAACNGPRSTVLAGPSQALEDLAAGWEEQGVFCRRLMLQRAYHHPALRSLTAPLREALAEVVYRPACIPVMCTVTGGWATPETLARDYWSRSVIEPVRFFQGVQQLVSEGYRTFIEIGPHPVLGNGIRDVLDGQGTVLPTLVRLRPERQVLLESVGRLYELGWALQWDAINPAGAWVDVPRYPWANARYWSETREACWERIAPSRHPLLGQRTADPETTWIQALDTRVLPFLAGHRLGASLLVSASTYISMMIAAEYETRGPGPLVIDSLQFTSPCFYTNDERRQLRTTVSPGTGQIEVRSSVPGEPARWSLHAESRVLPRPSVGTPRVDVDAIRARCPQRLSMADFHVRTATDFDYHDSFDRVQEIWLGIDETLAVVQAGSGDDQAGLLDSCMQGAALYGCGTTLVPKRLERMRWFGTLAGRLVAHVRRRQTNAAFVIVDVVIADEQGNLLVAVDGLVLRTHEAGPVADSGFLAVRWRPQALSVAPAPGPRAGLLVGAPDDRLADWPRFEPGAAALPSDTTHIVYRVPTVETARAEQALLPVLALLKTLAERTVRLLVVTERAGRVGPRQGLVEPAAASVWGLVRTALSEHPRLQATLLDLDTYDSNAVWDELVGGWPETEVAWRDGQRYVARLEFCHPVQMQPEVAALVSADTPYRVEAHASGRLDEVRLRRQRLTPLGPHDVEIAVEAAALNFADVMKALAVLPGLEHGSLGLGVEAAGTIRAVGSEVSAWRVGDPVVAIGPNAVANRLVVTDDDLLSRPLHLDPAAAAGLPVVFMTALYALETQARLQPGEKVLIHSAAGGLGQAAIQVARHLGAEVLATAGSEEKRAWLRSLGVVHVFDSRRLTWVDDVLRATGGVDVVLNSLAGEAMQGGLEVLRDHGRMVEVGKRDIWGGSVLPLSPFRRNLSYFAVDLDALMRDKPPAYRRLLASLRDMLPRLQPPPPRTFDMDAATDALRLMSSGEHRGKVVLTRPSHPVTVVPATWTGPVVRPDATYLVTGGSGGAGQVCAGWLASQGARHLLLLSRSGQFDPSRFADWPVQVQGVAADVSDREALQRVLQTIPADRPLRGVLHAAMVLDDCVISAVTPERLQRVLAPKLTGAWHLHELTADLDFFVLFSSLSTLFGAPGQASYCAANAGLDALSQRRYQLGLPCISVNWSAMTGFGYLHDRPELSDYLEAGGQVPMDANRLVMALEVAMRSGLPQLGAARFHPEGLARLRPLPKYAELPLPGAPQSATVVDPARAWRAARPEDRPALAEALIAAQIARILRIDSTGMDRQRRLVELGLDSLMALELRNWLMDSFGVSISGAEALRTPTVADLAHLVMLRHRSEEAVLADVT